ncbi:hypothetical protein BpHYR1_019780 [Brachionus plicatilis]|uniref:Uncharacterized protein n=1 Tax=Brachionus plicatilis TaxID=10195 RepID=A0A3M7PS30_BRAPC|nr:hypothetical protein BpHYR1_019780 [Brachionus plicatilis]
MPDLFPLFLNKGLTIGKNNCFNLGSSSSANILENNSNDTSNDADDISTNKRSTAKTYDCVQECESSFRNSICSDIVYPKSHFVIIRIRFTDWTPIQILYIFNICQKIPFSLKTKNNPFFRLNQHLEVDDQFKILFQFKQSITSTVLVCLISTLAGWPATVKTTTTTLHNELFELIKVPLNHNNFIFILKKKYTLNPERDTANFAYNFKLYLISINSYN